MKNSDITLDEEAELNKIFDEITRLDDISESVCPNWWYCRGTYCGNGYIDTYACKEHHACDVIMIKPYTDEQLKAELQRVCELANTEENCNRRDKNEK